MKAVGFNGVPTKLFKAMDTDCRRCVFDFINEFLYDRANFESWHKSQCVLEPKSGYL